MLSCKINLLSLILLLIYLRQQLGGSNTGQTLAVQIHTVNIPSYVELTASSFILDCDYSYDLREDERLAVRWFRNKDSEPFYQWLPELQNRHHADWIKPFIDEHFIAPQSNAGHRINTSPLPSPSIQSYHQPSNTSTSIFTAKLNKQQQQQQQQQQHQQETDPYKKYRALKITKVHPTLTGTYTCIISSLAGQDQRHAHTIVFAPPKVFTFEHKFEVPNSSSSSSSSGATDTPIVDSEDTTESMLSLRQSTQMVSNTNNWWLQQQQQQQQHQQKQQPRVTNQVSIEANQAFNGGGDRQSQWHNWPKSILVDQKSADQIELVSGAAHQVAATNNNKRVIYSHDGRQVMWLDDSPVQANRRQQQQQQQQHQLATSPASTTAEQLQYKTASDKLQQQKRRRRQLNGNDNLRQGATSANKMMIIANDDEDGNTQIMLHNNSNNNNKKSNSRQWNKQHKLECKAKQITPRPILILLVQRVPNGPFEFVRQVLTQISPYYVNLTTTTTTTTNNNSLLQQQLQTPVGANNKGTPFFDITLSAVIQLSRQDSDKQQAAVGDPADPASRIYEQDYFEIVPDHYHHHQQKNTHQPASSRSRFNPSQHHYQQQQQQQRLPMLLPYKPNQQLTFECRLEITGTEHEQRKRLTLSTNELYVSISDNQAAPRQDPPDSSITRIGEPQAPGGVSNDPLKQLESAYHSSSSAASSSPISLYSPFYSCLTKCFVDADDDELKTSQMKLINCYKSVASSSIGTALLLGSSAWISLRYISTPPSALIV